MPGESLAVEVGGPAEPVQRSNIDHKARTMAGRKGDEKASEYGPSMSHPFGTQREKDPEAKGQAQPRTRTELRW